MLWESLVKRRAKSSTEREFLKRTPWLPDLLANWDPEIGARRRRGRGRGEGRGCGRRGRGRARGRGRSLHREPMADIIDDVDDVALMPSMLDGHVTDSSSDEDSDEEEQRVQAELARDRSNTRRSMDLFLDGPILGDGIVESVAVNPPLRRSSRNKA